MSDTPDNPQQFPPDDYDEERSAGSLKKRTVVGTMWVSGGDTTHSVLRLFSNVALAWLLFPEAFGLMAMVLLVTTAVEMFSNMGLPASVVQNPRGDDPYFLNNVWTLKIIRGLLMWLVAAAAAYPMAIIYQEHRLIELIPVAGMVAVAHGFSSTKMSWNKRHLRYLHITAVELGGYLVAVITMLILAWLLQDVWALVFGSLVGSCTKMVLTHTAIPGPPNRFAWHTPTVLSLLNFGKWLFAGSVFTFFAKNLDKLLLGLLEGAFVLGVYRFAHELAHTPLRLMTKVNHSVLFPAFSKQYRSDPERLVHKVRAARRAVLLAASFIVLGICLLAPIFFEVLYPADYAAAGWMAQLACVVVWFSNLKAISARALLARGVTWVFAADNGLAGLATLGASLAGYQIAGVPGFIGGLGLGAIAGYAVVQYAMLINGMSMWWQDVKFTALVVVLAGVGVFGQASTGYVTNGAAAIVMQAGIAAVILVPYGLWATSVILTMLFGPDWDGLWQRVEPLFARRLPWVVPQRYRNL